MAKKKKTIAPPKPEVFRSNAFNALKGIVAPPAPNNDIKSTPVVALQPVATKDSDLFLDAMSDVRPLSKLTAPTKPVSGKKPADVPITPASDRKNVVDKVEQETFATAISQLKLDVTFSDQYPESDEIKSLGANRLRQIKKGIITVNRQLDLHGLTREEALSELPRFLRNASAYGEKAVLVITGKGLNSPGEPVLQQAVAGWLRDTGKKLVLEFAPAPRDMGGHGAFVVFLRN
jgi:DNA-nicking Smr family endonuclease